MILSNQTVRAQKQIPALPRLSRYMNRNYKLGKEETQRLLDLAVEDNLIKLHKKVRFIVYFAVLTGTQPYQSMVPLLRDRGPKDLVKSS